MNQLLNSRLTNDYEVLTDNLQKLMQVQYASEIFNLIGEGLQKLVPNSVIIINQVLKEEKTTTTKGIYGLDENVLYNLLKKLPINPIGKTYPLKPELLALYKISDLHKIPNGLATFSNNAFPSKILNELERFLNIKQIYTVGLRKQGKLYTIIHIFKRKNPEIQNIDIVQQLLNQSSIALQNRLYQIELEQKEKALEQALKEANSGYIIWNSVSNKLQYSNQFLHNLGYRSVELKRDISQWKTLVHPDDKRATLNKIARFFQENIPFQIEYRIKAKSGNYKWFEANFKINEADLLNQDEILIAHKDINESKRNEIALQQSKKRLQTLANVTQEGIIIHQNGICIDLNNATLEITGFTKNDLMGKAFSNIIFCTKEDAELINLNDNKPHIICAKNKNEKNYFIEITNRKFDEKYEVLTIRNISELKEKELELQSKNKELNELLELKNQFLTILSHDLKNPLSSTNGILDLLDKNLEKYPKEKIRRLIRSVAEESKNTYILLESLLLWSQKDRGSLKLYIQSINLKKEFNKIVSIYTNQLNYKNIKPTIKISESVNIETDKQILKVILRNLIGNAIKYTPQNKSIVVEAFINNKLVTINIQNEGSQIDQETINSILQSKKVKSTKGTANEKGTGFGLSIVKDLIQLLGSQLEISSNEKTTTFSFSL